MLKIATLSALPAVAATIFSSGRSARSRPGDELVQVVDVGLVVLAVVEADGLRGDDRIEGPFGPGEGREDVGAAFRSTAGAPETFPVTPAAAATAAAPAMNRRRVRRFEARLSWAELMASPSLRRTRAFGSTPRPAAGPRSVRLRVPLPWQQVVYVRASGFSNRGPGPSIRSQPQAAAPGAAPRPPRSGDRRPQGPRAGF